MLTDVAGRVKNVQLPPTKPLLPLFEAIINSIHAIEDAKKGNGKIDIEVIRDGGLLTADSEKHFANVIGFIVKDNGIGFNKQNFEAFCTSDTTYKANRGGKGIGRFMWLAGFKSVHIESVYKEGEILKKRSLDFLPEGNGVFNNREEKVSEVSTGALIELKGFLEKHQKQCPKKISSIAEFIVEEFLEYFIGPACPKITLRDSLSGEIISLDDVYDKEMVTKAKREKFKIDDHEFEVLHVKIYSTHVNDHFLYLCANYRAVLKDKLTGRIPNLVRRLKEENGNEFVYACYVTGDLLDASVNAERTNFNLSVDGSGLLTSEMTVNRIREKVIEKSVKYLAPFTGPIGEMKKKRVQEFIENDGLMYRPLLKRLDDKVIEGLDPEASVKDIDKALYNAYQEIQVEIRDGAKQLLETEPATDLERVEYEKQFREYFDKMTAVNQSDLARYVLHRKLIIEFFKKQLGIQEDGKYSWEKNVHDVIFPRGKTSHDLLYEEHNLWLVDERMAFNVYLSSDQPLKRVKLLKNESENRPDILIFDKAAAFSEQTNMPFGSITIIEFKRPMREDYGADENPFDQIETYIDDIKAGKVTSADGRHINIPPNFPFNCFVICDPTPNIKKWAKRAELQETPDGLGYFGYKRNFNAYFEVISYQKLVSDAQKRNEAFFRKLGL